MSKVRNNKLAKDKSLLPNADRHVTLWYAGHAWHCLLEVGGTAHTSCTWQPSSWHTPPSRGRCRGHFLLPSGVLPTNYIQLLGPTWGPCGKALIPFGFKVFFNFLKSGVLIYYLHSVKVNKWKCTIWWVLTYENNCVVITTSQNVLL